MGTIPRPGYESLHTPVERLLSRLHRVKQRGPRRWSASCPCSDHAAGDRNPSLSIREAPDGKVLAYCFGGHSAQDVAEAVGLTMSDLFPASGDRFIPRPRPRSRPVPRSVAEVLLESALFPEAWEIAKSIAPLEPAQARRDVLESWDFVSDNGGVPAVMDLYALLRGIALFRYADPARAHEPSERRRAVGRLVEELSR